MNSESKKGDKEEISAILEEHSLQITTLTT